MKLYSIMPMFEDHIEEICEDAARQIRDGIATEVLFKMTLTPEGNPEPIDKASILAKAYRPFKERLNKLGYNAGILVQATMGHGYALTNKSPFTRFIGVTDGLEKAYNACPFDEDFRKYLYDSMATLAKEDPSSIMIDDDFRLFARGTRGCACKLHMAEISRRFGRDITREELVKLFECDTDEGRRAMRAYYESNIDALIGAAKAIRAGIDSVNPRLQGTFCLCGDTCEGVGEIAKILAGEGNPVIVRVNNGKYCAAGARGISSPIARAATQIGVIEKDVDIILAETDTCPQNRYSTSSMSLHTHFTASIMEGAKGAKHWITRLSAYEPKSGEAYRKVLSKYSGFYNELSEIIPRVEWFGARIPLADKAWEPKPPLSKFKMASEENSWMSCVLERLGLPVYFSKKAGGAVFLDGRRDELFDDEKIREMLGGTLFLASESAISLTERGFGDEIGVNVTPKGADDENPTNELVYANGKPTKCQNALCKLVPKSDKVRPRSMLRRLYDGVNYKDMYPGVTTYENSLGGTVNVFSGTPRAAFNYMEAFSFLNETRKAQLIELLSEGGNLPIYYPDDAEVYMKAGYIGDEIFCAFTNIGLDNLDEVTLVCEREVNKIRVLCPSGEYKEVEFNKDEHGVITVNTPALILAPVIMLID